MMNRKMAHEKWAKLHRIKYSGQQTIKTQISERLNLKRL